jgi:intron-binding protein aquarius
VGYLRDIRRLTVALSRARLGLYVLGRREVFESCYELAPFFNLMFQRPTKIQLVKNEFVPTPRLLNDDVEQEKVVEFVDAIDFFQYVTELTKAKVEALKRGEAMPIVEEVVKDVVMDDDDDDDDDDGQGEIVMGGVDEESEEELQ